MAVWRGNNFFKSSGGQRDSKPMAEIWLMEVGRGSGLEHVKDLWVQLKGSFVCASLLSQPRSRPLDIHGCTATLHLIGDEYYIDIEFENRYEPPVLSEEWDELEKLF